MREYMIDKLPDKSLLKVVFTDKLGKYPDTIQISGKEAELQQDYQVDYIYKNKETYRVIAKKGFVFDGFSTDFLGVPRMLQGKFTGAVCMALFHDLDYCTHFSRTRSNADWNLLIGLKSFGYWWITRNLIYVGVKAGGVFVYNKTKDFLQKNKKHITIYKIG